jgi:RNA ligase (TIGR02306 family)
VEVIKEIGPIANADSIDVAAIQGWKVVVKKGEFREGDLCVYCEIDSILPEIPEFEFLRPRKFRIKTMRLRGQISQGIAFTLGAIRGIVERNGNAACPAGGVPPFEVGQDLTEALGIVKYEPPVAVSQGDAAGPFPAAVPKTDETRIQSAPELIDEFKGLECYVALKHDGTSATYLHHNGEFKVCSRTMARKDGDNIYWKMARKYRLPEVIGGYAIQGEICGPGIQKNHLGLKDQELFVFSVYDTERQRYLDYAEFIAFCRERALTTVRILDDHFIFNVTADDLLEMAKGKYEGTTHNREGIVIRPLRERYSECLHGRLSMKVINNDYLLKEEE